MAYETISCKVADALITGIFDKGFFSPEKPTDTPHSHKYTEIHASRSGYSIEDTTGKSKIDVSGDVLALVGEGYYHSCKASTDAERFILKISVSPARDCKSGLSVYEPIHGELAKARLLSLRVDGAFDILKRIKAELSEKRTGSTEAASALFTQFAVSLCRAFESKRAKGGDGSRIKELPDDMIARIEKIEHFLFTHASSFDSRASKLASELGLSVRQLNRIFKSYYGSSFGQMLSESRLKRAEKLLTTTNEPIEGIAFDVGYRSVSTFLAAFKKRYGTTPNKYRRGYVSEN